MLHATSRSRRPNRNGRARNHRKLIHATSSSRRNGIVRSSSRAHAAHRFLGVGVRAWMDASSFDFCRLRSGLAGRQFSSRAVPDLGADGLTYCSVRSSITDSPHGSTSAAYDTRSSPDLAGGTGDAVLDRPSAVLCASRWSAVPVVAVAATGKSTCAASVLLVSRHCSVGGLACSSSVYARTQVGSVAYGRARILPSNW